MSISRTYYISSGSKNAMYTLRVIIKSPHYACDNYICNLSTNPEKAEQKAKDYYDAMVERIGSAGDLKMIFAGYADFDLFERREKLSVQDTESLEMVENGIMPFGKNKFKRFNSLPDNTLMWWGEQEPKTDHSGIVFNAVVSAIAGICLEKGLYAKREELKQEMIARDMASEFVGEPKKRMDFEGVVEVVASLGFYQVSYYATVERFLTKIRVGENILVYFGNKVAEKGDEIKFRATVKEHSVRENIKQTIVQRVAVEEK